MERDDAATVRRVLAGEVQAYRTIVERHQARIFFLGLKFLHRYEDAEDFAQEVFLRAYERLGSFTGKGSFAGWLYRVAFNLAVNKYREARMLQVDLSEHEELPDDAPQADERLLSAESKERVSNALAQLPGRYALVIKMHYFDDLSYPEIAAALAVPVNTVKSHVFRAKALIRERLGSYLEE